MLSDDQIETVPGTDVYDSEGAKIGQAGALYTDDATGSPEWVTVHTGLFGMKHNLMPLTQAELHDDHLTVPFSRDQVKDAPTVDPDDGRLSSEEEQRLFDHYGHVGPRALRRDTDLSADTTRLRKYEVTQQRTGPADNARVKVHAQNRPSPAEVPGERNEPEAIKGGGLRNERLELDAPAEPA